MNQTNTILKPKVFVAMSGGVDSSVAAALLKKSGFRVVGVYMKCWQEGRACTSQDDERSARLAAAHLEIPFYTWNFIKEYKKTVVEYMLKGYEKGITPNPDVMCNKEIKFGLFFDKAMKLGADFIATGHYALVKDGKLFEAKDKNKDQSYFLSFIKPEVLSRTLFPIGDYTKQEVRALAKEFGLPNAQRKSSQGVCFIGKLDFADFLQRNIPCETGEIVDLAGRVLGEHQGLALYTVGQRRGIRLSGGPYYVVRKYFERNELVVSKDEEDLQTKETFVRNVNWFSNERPSAVETKIRYRSKSARAAIVAREHGVYQLLFEEPQRAITPGQFAVFYKDQELLGGGVIE